MAMKWKNLTPNQVEITFDSGTRILAIDRKNTAAVIQLPNGTQHYILTKRNLSELDRRHTMVWFGSQPMKITHVDDSAFDQIINKEHK